MRSHMGYVVLIAMMIAASMFVALVPDFHLSSKWASVSAAIAVLVVILLFLPTGKERWQHLRHLCIWAGILAVLVISYGFQHELGIVWKRFEGALFPSDAISHSDGSVTFQAQSNGHFYINARLGNVPVRFLLDTGASSVVLTKEDAIRLGVDPKKLYYDKIVYTANGKARAASVTIPRLSVGTITIENVEAVVNESELDISLLGMSFLGRLESYEVAGPVLTLRN